jgi:hypothetical protein
MKFRSRVSKIVAAKLKPVRDPLQPAIFYLGFEHGVSTEGF